MRSKSTPSNSPSDERSHSQRQEARSEPGHARNDAGHGERALRAVEAQSLQKPFQAMLLHRPQTDMLDPRRARADQLQRADIHRLQVGAAAGRRAVDQLRDKALGMPLNLCRTGQRLQIALAVEQLPDAGAQNRPVMAFEREVAAEVEQCALPDLLACALRAHQTMRIIDLAARAGAGSGEPDEHGAQHRDGRKSLEPQCKNIMALHRRPENLNPAISKACQTSRPQYRPNPLHKR